MGGGEKKSNRKKDEPVGPVLALIPGRSRQLSGLGNTDVYLR